ncbi:MAG TPA: carbamate kinase [Symbiobacteriaceae bacterium]|nr:carbamate kinase [Symbiobacteriaceae bacterium]
MKSPSTVVIALGGNAILQSAQKGTYAEQLGNISAACAAIVEIVKAGHKVVLTHGNGPQVGAVLIQNEEAATKVPAMPLDACGAETQGMLGYMFQQELGNALRAAGLNRQVVSIVTQTEVSAYDLAFKNPTKPVGPYYPTEEAQLLMAEKGWQMKEDKARGGWRRLVPSPSPIAIVEKEIIKNLLAIDAIVIAAGGGGAPVVQERGQYHGVEAVVDKDLSGFRMAADIGADAFMILTDVERVAINWGKPDQVNLSEVSYTEMRALQTEGHFADGSMGPKVEACLRFAQTGKGRAIIAAHVKAVEALAGTSGTQILPL